MACNLLSALFIYAFRAAGPDSISEPGSLSKSSLKPWPPAIQTPVTASPNSGENDGKAATNVCAGWSGQEHGPTLYLPGGTRARIVVGGSLEPRESRPLDFLLGKLMPYGLVGLAQAAFLLFLAGTVFQIPFRGPLHLLVLPVCLFISANLLLGATFSTLARNQTQAMQMTFFFFLPSTLLSGFMFPFVGMPRWAQALGEALPLTHFLRIVRGVLLKGFTAPEIVPHLWPIALFCVAAGALSVICFRETLD